MNYAIIMAGGVGTRFWPKGIAKLPKQYLKIQNDTDSMIQQTFKRLEGVIPPENIFVVTNIAYKGLTKKHLPKIPEENIICEPFGRNTAPCIGLACLYIKQFNKSANVLVIPSDHIIKNVDEFRDVVKCGLKFSRDYGGIVTLGISPTKPETGYGYIQFDTEGFTEINLNDTEKSSADTELFPESEIHEKVYKVKTFAEKPNIETAKAFIESGDFLWNSGMFIFRVDAMLEEIKTNIPDLYDSLNKLEKSLMSKDFEKELERIYGQIKGISIDYGVMEKSRNVHTIRSYFDWSDLGSWDEIYNFKEKDADGNVKQGKVLTINSKNCLIINDQRISALVGVEDLLVIDTDNGLLICKRGESQNVKEVVDYLRRKGLDQYL
ncbi:MAG: mannose-1-phosphate guanylyltransferase [Ignavibacteriae bacterium]|jgi:mannose-1-phosphate guanylyltransferase|nr:mannose-1-phosphate guanylyltransferase [Ignavibacteriota bacterium]